MGRNRLFGKVRVVNGLEITEVEVHHTKREAWEHVMPLLVMMHEAGMFCAGGYPRIFVEPYVGADYGAPEDIDFFGYHQKSWEEGLRVLIEANWYVTEETDWSVRLKNPVVAEKLFGDRGFEINLVKDTNHHRYAAYGNPVDMLKRFDFIATMAYIDMCGPAPVIMLGDGYLDDIASGELRVNYLKDPHTMIRRAAKYAGKGFMIPMATIIRVLATISDDELEKYREYSAWYNGELDLTRPEISDLYRAF